MLEMKGIVLNRCPGFVGEKHVECAMENENQSNRLVIAQADQKSKNVSLKLT